MRRTALNPLAALAAVLCSSLAHAQMPASVRLDRVREETVAQQREATGSIITLLRSAVATQEEGLVLEMNLQVGDSVKAGDVIAHLDDARAKLEIDVRRARVQADQAVIEQRRAELERSKRDLERIQKLADLASAGESEQDVARTLVQSNTAQLAESEATLATDKAELALAERTLADMTIRAPFDGRVVLKQTEAGQWVSKGDPIVTLVSLDRLEARADIPERSVGALQLSDGSVEVSVPALGQRLTGSLIEIVPEADSLSRLFPIRIRLNDPEHRLRPGMSLTAMVPTGESGPALTLSEDAILRNAAGEYVYFDAGGTSQIAPIERLFRAANGRIAVRSPVLRAGMLVVIEGNERLFPATPLNVLNASDFPEVVERQKKAAEAAANAGKPGAEG